MNEGDKLINLNLQIEQNKEDINFEKGYKLYLLEALYSIQQVYGRYPFWDILFTIIEFIQIMAFPMDKIFDESWGNYWVKTIGNFFRYFQIFFLWEGTSFFIITYIIICIFIIIFLALFFYVIIKSITFTSEKMIKMVALILQLQNILTIPLLKTLFSIFSCENGVIESSPEIKCESGVHIFLIVISVIFTIIYQLMIILFHTTLYEFGVNTNKLKSGYTSSTEVFLDLNKLILIIVYQFISHQMALSIITLLISVILLMYFLIMQPYSSGFTMKLYFALYSLFCWSSIICIVSILLKNSNFRSGIVLLILGYPLIIISIYIIEIEFSFDKYLSFYLSKYRGGYNNILEIEYFLKLEDSLIEKIKTREYKLLFLYISEYESKCTDPNCFLKRFTKIKFQKENFQILKILLLQHAEMLFKQAISKYPNYIKLRIGYILFLFNKMNKKLKGKNELILVDDFEKNLECSFLIYKVKKFAQDILNDKEENIKSDNKENVSFSLSFKLISKAIKSLIENIVTNYVSFWNILLIHDWNNPENFIKMSHLGEDIKSLNKELNQNIESLETWNLLDQETIKIYSHYLKEIINNNEKADIFCNKISEEEQNKHMYDEINIFELNYKEMSKNEDYKYIIINYSKEGLLKILNVSFPVCKLFGYTREDLIGRPLDILFPDIYNNDLKLFFQSKVEEYKHNLLMKTKKLNSDSWTLDCFGKNKGKCLIHFKAKWSLTSLDDDQIYGIGNILLGNKKILNDKDEETVYVLTDKNLIIQNFTANALKILRLNFNSTINNSNISNYIIELNENFMAELESKNEREESNINNKKNQNLKRKTRYIKSDILRKYNYLGNNLIKVIHWRINGIIDFNNIKKNQDTNKNKLRNDFSMNVKSSISIRNSNQYKSSEELLFLENVHNNEKNRKTSPLINKGINFTSIYPVEVDKLKESNEINNKENNNQKYKEQTLNMLLKEVKFNEHKIGYIFIFRPYFKKEGEKNTHPNEEIKDLISSQEFKNMNVSDVSLMSFGEDKKKTNHPQTSFVSLDTNSQNNDNFFLNYFNEKENQFTFDINDMTFKQFKYCKEKESFYEDLKAQAILKVTNVKTILQNEESEEDEEFSESDYSSDSNISDNSLELSKDKKEILSNKSAKTANRKLTDENQEKSASKQNTLVKNMTQSSKNVIPQNSLQNILKTPSETHKKKEEEDYYHVNINKISYYVFNFTSGYVELQKGASHKISQVVYIMDQEKEKLKNPNTRYVANAKFFKGKKKGIINKKEENETNPYSITSMKLKEIYRALHSKDKEKSVIKMFLYSILIFVLVLGTGIMNIVVYSYLKENIYSFFILIQKSNNLYKNLLFEITLVKEMLILNSPYYTNTLYNNKDIYYQSLSQMVYYYYSDNAFIISNLTNNFNILTKKDEESITKKQIDLYILDSIKSRELNYYQYKTYSILVYSAYRELNSALYHISLLKREEIFHYNDDVYYFMKNGMSNLLISSEEQMWTLTKKFEDKITTWNNIIIICSCVIFLVYVFCLIIFIYFYNKVTHKKQKYLSIFNDLDNNLIISSLQKCEKFSVKLQERKETKEVKDDRISLESSSVNNSQNENENSSFLLDKKNKDEKFLQSVNNKKEASKKNRKSYIFQIILFLVLFAWQVGINIYYYLRMDVFKEIVMYEYYISIYAANFLFVFIGVREYIFDKNIIFYNQKVENYVDTTLRDYYILFSEKAKDKDKYRVIFPDSYQKFLNYLYNGQVCDFINMYKKQYPEDVNTTCDNFFYGSSRFGYMTVLAVFIEELRIMRDKIDYYFEIAAEKNFEYNESYYNDPNGYYRSQYEKYKNNIDEYEQYNPAKLLDSVAHKKSLITYLFINTQIYSNLISESLKQFEHLFSKYNSIYLIINILFLVLAVLGFLFIWTPFIFGENKNFDKIKNMLSIIPSELLINLPDINILIGNE